MNDIERVKVDIRSIILKARPFLTEQELAAAFEDVLRDYFMARVYPR